MQRRSGLLLLALGTCWTACAGRGPAAQHAPSAPDAPASCVASTHSGHKRGMTWSEYYTDVVERAQRNRATIIWINPPAVHVAADGARPVACR
jgi:hypothetical protein